MFTLRLVLPSDIRLGLRAPACVANMKFSLTQTHMLALLWCCCVAVTVLLLLLPNLALVTCHARALSTLVTRCTASQIVTIDRKHGGEKEEKEGKNEIRILWI